MESKIIVKFVFGEDIRRLSLLPQQLQDWKSFQAVLKKLYRHILEEEWSNIQIKYKDDEDDWIVVSSSEELSESLSQNNERSVLRFTLENKSQTKRECHVQRGPMGHGGWRRCGRGIGRGCGNRSNFWTLHRDALNLMKSGKVEDLNEARKKLLEQIELKPSHPIPMYNLACTEALLGNTNAALEYLEKSINLGFQNVNHAENDSDLDSLRKEEKYQSLINALKEKKQVGEQVKNWGWCGPWGNRMTQFKWWGLQSKIMALFDQNTKDALEQARTLLFDQASLQINSSTTTYNLACVEALLGNSDNALKYLEQAIQLGFKSVDHIENDQDLVSLRHLDTYKALIATLKPQEAQIPVQKSPEPKPVQIQVPVQIPEPVLYPALNNPPEELAHPIDFATQSMNCNQNMALLKEMGFTDVSQNFSLLLQTGNDIDKVVQILFDQF